MQNKKIKKATKKEIQTIKALFLEHYKNAKTELIYRNDYELLIAVMLSAQCTDKRVNLITPALFDQYPTPQDLKDAPLEDIKNLIKSCSFFNNKATNLKAMAKEVCEKFDGVIPLDREALKSLPGVGQKTANVVLIESKEANFIAVDTHVFRVSHRLGLSNANTPLKTEEDLTKIFADNLATLHQAMVLFGRYICKALNPQCQNCFLSHLCKSKMSYKC
ncbi:endonuclease III [Helicobacter canadensis]|uniref:Endonuclease III n=1 Tax=Helicobacter canadensis MIT 98-5491 TaxID=537970 RepID=C5ZX32_9HELI|nr:endonuclease III [Helicobacter canadensis]EES89700.1 endonuclease III [Helicobacter canadensis MIT 98-5491]EFR48491.1 endonuclease III [Helicobacter canadensis MIT 98-5491]STO99736.1 endonuclease III [Helicobacter canadensis]